GNLGRPSASVWPTWLPWFGPGTLMALALLFYAGVCAIGTFWLMRRQAILLWAGGIGFLVVLVLTAGIVALAVEQSENQLHPPVVITKQQTLHRGNGKSYAAHEKIPMARPGMEGRLLFQRGDWLQIEFAGGHVGWLHQSAAIIGP